MQAAATGVFWTNVAEGCDMAKLLATVETAMSPERLSPYRKVCGGGLSAAVELHEWNAAVSAAV